MNTTKTVDVVIPTYKPDEKYDRLLQMLKKQIQKKQQMQKAQRRNIL